MTWESAMPTLIVGTSLLTGLLIFFLEEKRQRLRSTLNLLGAGLKLVFVGIIIVGTLQGREYEFRFPLVLGFDFLLRVDMLSLLFVTLSGVLWFVTTIYAIGYLEGSEHRSRFFGFFSICVAASTGIALAGNLITFFIFYEFLTLSTYPLVVHRGTEESLRAGRTYLWYTITGGTVLFVGVAWLNVLVGDVDFSHAGSLASVAPYYHTELIAIFVLLIAGLGVKAALVPLHGWLPVAMVAPAPVSALLHAVAVVKAGAFGIVRVVYDVFGVSFANSLGVLTPLAILASITIIYGSLRAMTQDDLKKRLAYSTISQVSYITLGVALFGITGTIGSLVHLVHQGIMKITLFFCAGNVAETLGLHRISEMNGIGRRMPVTMGAFTVAALGMIGLPPIAGFISKWYLALGGLEAGKPWVVVVLLVSSLLNAAYFLPILHAAWFKKPSQSWSPRTGKLETSAMLLVPPVITAGFSLAAGLFAASNGSPLALARQIAELLYYSSP
ncbi:MAG: monovalent cation/H+ antiporter subunit D family protein [Verrucomicrobia bacterium]|nr:monovalent cation/H+ antiporter subunit D family protein [Verrucomicrobiota bacterium]